MGKNSFAMAYGMKRKKMSKGGVTGGNAPGETYARGVSSQDSNTTPRSPRSPNITSSEQSKANSALDREHSRDACQGEGCPGCMSADCYAYGGVAGAQAPGEGFSQGISSQDRNTPAQRTISTTEDRSNNAMARNRIQREHDRERVFQPGQQLTEPQPFSKGGSVADRIRKRYAKGGEVDGGGYDFDIQDQLEHSNYYDKRNAQIADQELYDDDYGTDPRDSNETGDTLSDADENSKSMFKKIKLKKAQKGDRGDY